MGFQILQTCWHLPNFGYVHCFIDIVIQLHWCLCTVGGFQGLQARVTLPPPCFMSFNLLVISRSCGLGRSSGLRGDCPSFYGEKVSQVYSNLFTVKPNRGISSIFDLGDLNDFMQAQRFSLQSTRFVLLSFHQGDYLVSLGIKDAYLLVCIFAVLGFPWLHCRTPALLWPSQLACPAHLDHSPRCLPHAPLRNELFISVVALILRFCMRVLGLIVACFMAVQFCPFPLQTPTLLDKLFSL